MKYLIQDIKEMSDRWMNEQGAKNNSFFSVNEQGVSLTEELNKRLGKEVKVSFPDSSCYGMIKTFYVTKYASSRRRDVIIGKVIVEVSWYKDGNFTLDSEVRVIW